MAGLANSFLDSGTYPALMESFPHSASRANVLIKAFVSAGQFLLPFIISFLIWANLWFGWSVRHCGGTVCPERHLPAQNAIPG